MLGKLKGYSYGNDRRKTITHNFFVDDLKLYSSTINVAKKQLDLVTQFSNDICMDFGTNKCAYLKNVKGMIVSSGEPLVMNNLTIKPVKEGNTYKYSEIDEHIIYHGPINKERVIYEKETNDILRAGQKLLQKYNILSNLNEPPKSVSRKFTKADQTSKCDKFVQKPLHGYIY